MKIKLFEAVALHTLMEGLRGQKLPIRTAYNINLLLNSSLSHLQFYQEEIKKAYDSSGKKTKNGDLMISEEGMPVIEEENKENFNKDMQEISQMLVDMPDVIFSLDELSSIKISIEDMHVLMPFVEELTK